RTLGVLPMRSSGDLATAFGAGMRRDANGSPMEREGGVAAPSGSLLLFPGALGDAVCVEPAVAWLATRGPVTFLARGAAAEVAALFPARPTIGSIDDLRVARLFAPKAAGDDAPAWLAAFERV